MQKVEVIIKEIAHPRLTVTKDRITMKFPIDYPKVEEIKAKFLKVAEKIGIPENSLRGSLTENGFLGEIGLLDMINNKREIVYHFELKDL